MASKSPKLDQINITTITVLVDGSPIDGKYQLMDIQTVSEVNKIPRAWITIVDGQAVEPHFPHSDEALFEIGKEIEVKVGYHSNEASVYKGIIVEHGLSITKSGATIELECKHPIAKTTIARRTRTFVEKTDADVIQEILSENKIEGTTVKSTPYAYPKTVQYRATDWDFILARAEKNGMIATFDLDKMSIAPPEVSGTEVLGLTYGIDIYAFKAKLNNEHQVDNDTRKAWDIPNQELLEIQGKNPEVTNQGVDDSAKLASTYALKKIEATSSLPMQTDELQAWSDAKLQKSHLSRIRGKTTFQGSELAVVGKLISFTGVGDRFSKQAFISKVAHSIRGGVWLTTVNFGLSHHWFAKQPDFHAPLADGLLPSIGGLQIAKVFQIEEDPLGEARILVKIPVFGEDADGVWARMSHLYATKDHGFFFLPEVEDEVIVGFINDDPRYPVILGSLYSSANPMPYEATSDNFIKAITLQGVGGIMKLEFNEEKDIIIVETPAGNRITQDDDQKKTIIEDPNGNIITMSEKGIAMETPKDFTLDAKGLIEMTAGKDINITSKADINSDGMNIKSVAKINATMEAATSEVKGSAQAILKGGVVMIN